MKVKQSEVVVTFDHYSEAARWLFGYTNERQTPGVQDTHREFDFNGRFSTNKTAAKAAVTALVEHFGCETIEPKANAVPAITVDEITLVRTGHKIAAIKSIRTRTGCGLIEGKALADAVDKHYETPEQTWTDADGNVRKLSQMETLYLRNCLRLVERLPGFSRTGSGGIGVVDAFRRELRRRGEAA